MPAEHIHRSVCPNCDTALPEHAHYCPNCGQENHTHTRPFGHLMYEFVESITHFDAKLWATVKAIVTKPGQFVVDFVNDKRARYVPPARLYVFVSVIFFLMVNKVTDSALTQRSNLESKVHDVYGADAGEFTLNKVLGKRFIDEKGLNEAGDLVFYYNKETDPEAEAAIRSLKQLPAAQLDSLTREFNLKTDPDEDSEALDDGGKKPVNRLPRPQQLQKGVAYLPAVLPVALREAKTAERLVPVRKLVDSDELDSLHIASVNDLVIPFDKSDSTGQATLAAIKQYNKEQLLSLYAQTHPVLPEIRERVYADMKTLVTLLPQRFEIRDEERAEQSFKSVLPGVQLFFPNDSVQEAQMRLTKYMNDEQLTRFVEQHTSQSIDSLSWWKRAILLKTVRQGSRMSFSEKGAQREELIHNLAHVVIKYTSWVMFLLMPVVAFVLLIIYFRKQKYYYEHLIFSVHIHTVFFLILTVGLLINYYAHAESAVVWSFLIGYIYLLLAMKRTYAQSWGKTILKYVLFTGIYSVIFFTLFVISSFLGFLNF